MTPSITKNPRIALVYDRVNTSYGGAEHVLKAIGEIFPNAPLFTSVYSKNRSKWADSFKVIPSFLQKISFLRERHQWIALLMPMAFESLNLDDFDIIISITSAEAKGILTKPQQLHICYMLTPTRYLYSHKNSYLSSKKLLTLPIIKSFANLAINYIKWWDQVAAHRPDVIIPISSLIKLRIKKYYGLNSSDPIYPPVNIKLRVGLRKKLKQKNDNSFYLSLSRLVSYKKVDLSIRAAIELNRTLIVAGIGNQEEKLKKIAQNKYIERKADESIDKLLDRSNKQNKNIIFTKETSQDDVNLLLSSCRALIMPGEEDFGITGLEASILGKPVIVFYKSGVSELLENGVDSIFIKKETKEEIIKAIKKIEKTNFNTQLIKLKAKKNSTDKFKKEFRKKVLSSWEKFILNT